MAFEKISQNPNYFRLSIILFIVACFSSFFAEISELFFQTSHGFRGTPNLAFHVVNFGGIVLNNFLIILFVFFIGRKLGGSTSFRQIFTSMSFCLIPVIIGTMILALSTFFYFFSIPSYDTLSPSYASTFMLSPPMLSNFIIIPFFVWSLILYFKSIKITNNFTNFKTILTLGLAFLLMYLESMFYDLTTSIPLQFLYH
ncbi:MAG: YIP1 family protein [Nitrosopumilus sp.]|uniref:YIP1 family protein n=1 Tax=Nitrosopumilus sp. TaxID=2024843 RepID=UPI00247DF108|nr:YIP1 family protein [Nitrosopumilus sp.]